MRFPSLVAILMLSALALTGCPKRQAAYRADGRGGWVLTATAESLDDAMKQFERTAAKLCPDGSYQLGEPEVHGSGRPIDAAIDLECTGP